MTGYFLVRPLARLLFRIFYKRLHLLHLERVPKGKPILLAVNHPTAFMEPCIMACTLPFPIYFLVRGDLFKTRWASWALHQVHLLPIYRTVDGGFGDRRKNLGTMQKCFDTLASGTPVMILAEGRTIMEKRLRPLRKGTARLAFGAVAAHPDLDLQVVPVGVTYSRGESARTEVVISFGEAIPIRQYDTSYAEHPQRAYREFLEDLRPKMEAEMVLIPKPEDEPLTECLLEMQRNQRRLPLFPVLRKDPVALAAPKQLAATVDGLSKDGKNRLWAEVEAYFALLARHGLDDETVSRPKTSVGTYLLMFLFAPLGIAGILLNVIPSYLGFWIARTKVKVIEFFTPVWAATYIGIYPLYMLLVGLLVGMTQGWQWGLVAALLVIPIGYIALLWAETGQRMWKRWRLWAQPRAFRERVQHIRSDLWAEIEALEG